MTIATVESMSGKAEVQGVVRGFLWEMDTLTIRGVGYGDLLRILDALSSGKLWDERPPLAANGPINEPVTVARVAADVPAPAVAIVAAVPTAAHVAAAPAGELPLSDKNGIAKAHELQTADTLVKALTFLRNKGFDGWKTLLDECQRIKEDVPVLKKIDEGSFRDRILRVANTKLQMDVPAE